MPRSFNVLDRSESIRQNYVLEASAGTGKTFSIENIVVRLLLEGEKPFTLDQILIVTFTRASTRDLKSRIRANIEKTLVQIKHTSKKAPDYVLAILEQEKSVIEKAVRNLENALFGFDQAQIFTIHGFCSRVLRDNVLEGDFGLSAMTLDDQVKETKILSLINDFFRSELSLDVVSPGQLSLLLKTKNLEALKRSLVKYVASTIEISSTIPYKEHLKQFQEAMQKLCHQKNYKSEFLKSDYEFEKLKYKAISLEKEAKIMRFFALCVKEGWNQEDFDTLIQDGLVVENAFSEEQRRKKTKPLPAYTPHYPGFLKDTVCYLSPILNQAASYTHIFARLAHHCQKLVRRYLEEEEKFRFDDLLEKTLKALENPDFIQRIQERYQAAIIDEFQDTDPLQWEIFHRLFAKKRLLYLVGDPKQSIYGFRQADIYTYLKAAANMGKEAQASLDTNFRSSPLLVSALNTLFGKSKGLFPLPRIQHALEYPEVKFSSKVKEQVFNDSLGSLHFFIATEEPESGKKITIEGYEEQFLLPFILQELQRLHQIDGFGYQDFAILVRDHRQALRVHDYLKIHHIPCALQKSETLAKSVARELMQELLQAALNPRNGNALKKVLGGPLFGLNHQDLLALNRPEKLEPFLYYFYQMRRILKEEGFSSFYYYVMNTPFGEQELTIAEVMLKREEGVELYNDMEQIAELLIEHQSLCQATPQGLIAFLDEFEVMEIDQDERLKKRRDSNQHAVQVLTMHTSKGLEFALVFALGLISQPPILDELLLTYEGDKPLYQPFPEESTEAFAQFCQEQDAEKMRQLYVACTRAKYRLYVPAVFKSAKVARGRASPIELFLAKMSSPEEDPYTHIPVMTRDVLTRFIDDAGQASGLSYCLLNDYSFQHHDQNEYIVRELFPPLPCKVPGKHAFLQSFTTLAKPNLIIKEHSPKDFNCLDKTPHTLPSSAATGIMLHAIMENLSWKQVASVNSPRDLQPLLDSQLGGSEYEPWAPVICELVFSSLTTDLGGFCLKDIDPHKIYRETEFLYSSPETQSFIKGIIDFAFEYQNKYYLVDWKSNWLGGGYSSYGQESLQLAMKEHDYELQSKIYIEAFRRFLAIVDPRPFKECFGGIYYLFMRGINSSEPKNGVYFQGGS